MIAKILEKIKVRTKIVIVLGLALGISFLLGEVFAQLSAAGLQVLSMRNKVNRLEEIFMRLVEKSSQANNVAVARS